MITKFGKELRKYRIDRSLTLRDLATAIGKSAAYLSAVESGKKKLTDDLVSDVIQYFKLDIHEAEQLKDVAAISRGEISIDLNSIGDAQKDSAVMFARRLHSLNPEELERINKILEEN